MSAPELPGIKPSAVHLNLSLAELVEHAIRRDEGELAASGAFAAVTGKHTGRTPKDRFVVDHPSITDRVNWGGFNQPVDPAIHDAIADKAREHMSGKELFVIDGQVGADPEHHLKVRVICEQAWHAMFCKQLFRRPSAEELEGFEPDFVITHAPNFKTDPERDKTRSEAFIALDLERRHVLVCGSHYAGEMKKSMFTAANFLFPVEGVLTMHCSSNVGDDGRVGLFFGLSGTGKTTLSADPERHLIGDDETGWSDHGVFNLEGGCYAKCINLSRDKEPQIYDAIRFGSILENVVLRDNREPDWDDASLTENTRAVYPLEHIPGFVEEGRAGHASTVVFLTADAFGVLPPVSILDADATMYHFLSGFTSKLAGTEVGVEEPEATFSTCFGAPFLPLAPGTYAEMLADRITRHGSQAFLINTGWSGGPFGVGKRMDLGITRAIVRAATSGALEGVATKRHPIFNLDVPLACPGVPDEMLDPQATWPDPREYERQARSLAKLFAENFKKFEGQVSESVRLSGPIAD